MGLFTSKQKVSILDQAQQTLEMSQRNLEYTQRIILPGVVKPGIGITGIKEELTQEEKIRAAYALNLCTVSVTQIIDYSDLNIMEQEYDTILNNLNLQNMPNDDALLEILKNILNTITFFKIEQKEREFVELDYQQKMKNAVWSAVPNIGTVIASGLSSNPAMAVVNLAASVGTAYMNYRKQKAENNNEYEREKWQLERSAIEQLDGLKRELFDTAWRLAKHYEFDDKLRLTERQIHQYNQILMDPDDYRRYCRLEAISDCFEAYPPFWYQMGHTANLVAIEAQKNALNQKDGDVVLENKAADYRKKALESFNKYYSTNKNVLLREDDIAATCQLEHAEILIQTIDLNDKDEVNKVLELLDTAISRARNSLDIVQLGAFSYLRIGAIEQAEKYLHILVNEQYNELMNAQLLSNIYVHKYITKKDNDVSYKYLELCRHIPGRYLFPMPEKDGVNSADLENQFLYIQKVSLLKKYRTIMNEVTKKYAYKYNCCLPLPEGLKVDNEVFEESVENRKNLFEMIRMYVISKKRDPFYFQNIYKEDLFEKRMDVLQEFYNLVIELVERGNNSAHIGNVELLKEKMLHPLSESGDRIERLDCSLRESSELNDEEQIETLKVIMDFSFLYFTYEMLDAFTKIVSQRICDMCSMGEISAEEAFLFQFSEKIGLSLPVDEYEFDVECRYESNNNFLIEELYGSDVYKNLKANKALAEKVETIIADYCKENDIIIRNNKSNLYIKGKDDVKLTKYHKKIRGNYPKSDVMLVIEENGLLETCNRDDLWFTMDGITVVREDRYPAKSTSYGEVKIEGDTLICNKRKYKNSKDLNMKALSGLIEIIKNELGEKEKAVDEKVGVFDDCFEVLEDNDNPCMYLDSESPFIAEKTEKIEQECAEVETATDASKE